MGLRELPCICRIALKGHINYCVDNVAIIEHIQVYPNQKAWMTKEVQTLLKDRHTAFRSGDGASYSAARANLKRGIRDAKATHKRKIEVHFTNNDPRLVWQGVQHITNYKTSNHRTADGEASLAEDINSFSARFEVEATESDPSPPTTSNSQILTVKEHDVRHVLRALNPRKLLALMG